MQSDHVCAEVADDRSIAVSHPELQGFRCHFDGVSELVFCNNDTRLHSQPNKDGAFKDAFHDYVIAGNLKAVNADRIGTKAAGLIKTYLQPGWRSQDPSPVWGKHSHRSVC